ncbi:hypothetical protein AO382_1095 [Moraxella catarrhalis]|uniref:Uncharacterized protein n=1 Tax=Moraxella catarrhalis TaxID=480 RepID=A0A7Z0UYS3_MORCA|nr:hypothetical protein AO382_1095 [Moraxella catarrhalis]
MPSQQIHKIIHSVLKWVIMKLNLRAALIIGLMTSVGVMTACSNKCQIRR